MFETTEEMWRSNKPNDLGYICEDCGNVPSYRELADGFCHCNRREHETLDNPE